MSQSNESNKRKLIAAAAAFAIVVAGAVHGTALLAQPGLSAQQIAPSATSQGEVKELLKDLGLEVGMAMPPLRFQPLEGIATTGANTLLGSPLFDLGDPFGTVGLLYVGGLNENGGNPLPLTPDSPASTVIVTIADPITLSLYGLTPADVPPSLVNVPLRDLPIEFNPLDTTQRAPLAEITDVGATQLSRATPSEGDITLAEWLGASGRGAILCGDPLGEGAEALVALKMEGLIPRGLYTVWAVFASPTSLFAIPLGGVPNATVADRNGRIGFERDLNFCPLNNAEVDESGARLVWIDILYHPDHRVFATYPDNPTAGHYPGVHSQVQMEFGVNVTSVN